MTETTPPPAPEPLDPGEPAAAEPPKAAPPEPANRTARVLSVLGFVLVVGALFYLWQQQQPLVQAAGVDPVRVTALEAEMRTLQQRVAQLEARPAPSAAPSIDLRPLEARIAALEQRPATVATAQPEVGPLLGRIDALERRVVQAGTDAATAATRADRAVRIEAAAAALAAGLPLGSFPDAPKALARFATDKPPTVAELRLAFPEAARRAAAASRPAMEKESMAGRVWRQVASMVTVRSGDRVIVGAPAVVVLDAAHERLDAGDIGGAVAALDGLDSGAAQAMAEWRGRAQALLDARAALASLAHG